MLNDQDKIKFQTFLGTLQQKCRERESSVSISASYNFFTNDWDVNIDYFGGRETYVVYKDYFDDWSWMRKISV